MKQRSATLARLDPLVALVIFALIPYGWIAEHWAWLDANVEPLFASEVAHAVGHTLSRPVWALVAVPW